MHAGLYCTCSQIPSYHAQKLHGMDGEIFGYRLKGKLLGVFIPLPTPPPPPPSPHIPALYDPAIQ